MKDECLNAVTITLSSFIFHLFTITPKIFIQ